MLNKFKLGVIGLLVAVGFAAVGAKIISRPSDAELRSSVVFISSPAGSCSGTQIEAPSGKKYILTAAHCRLLADKQGIMHISTEDAGSYYSHVIEEDDASDLLLLEPAPGIHAVKIAKDLWRFSHLRSFTHGLGLPTYKTEGSFIAEGIAQFEDGTPIDQCNKKKNEVAEFSFFGIEVKSCTVKVVESISDLMIVPGSSGGMIVNDNGELSGVASAGGDGFAHLVTLKDIRHFLENR